MSCAALQVLLGLGSAGWLRPTVGVHIRNVPKQGRCTGASRRGAHQGGCI